MIHTNQESRLSPVKRQDTFFPMPPGAMRTSLARLNTGNLREKAAREIFSRQGSWPIRQPDWRDLNHNMALERGGWSP